MLVEKMALAFKKNGPKYLKVILKKNLFEKGFFSFHDTDLIKWCYKFLLTRVLHFQRTDLEMKSLLGPEALWQHSLGVTLGKSLS